MGFPIGADDFARHRNERMAHDAEVGLINSRRRAKLLEQQGTQAPFIPTGQGAGLTVNQVGPTPAEIAAQNAERQAAANAVVAKKKAAEKKAAVEAAGLDTAQEKAAAAQSRVGLAGTPGIQQRDLDAPYPVAAAQKIKGWYDMDSRIRDLRQRIIRVPGPFTGRFYAPVTGPFNIATTGINELYRYGEKYFFADRARRERMDKEEAVHAWLDGGPGSKMLYARPELIIEAEQIGPEAFFDKYSGTPLGGEAKKSTAAKDGSGETKEIKLSSTPQQSTPDSVPVSASAPAPVSDSASPSDATTPDSYSDHVVSESPSKVKELPFTMPFTLRAQEINTLLADREGLKKIAFVAGGNPASEAFLAAHVALDKNRIAIENLANTQSLFMLQRGDPRMYNKLMARKFPGRGVRITPNSDGTFRVEADSKVIGARVNKTKLVTDLRKAYSIEFTKKLENAAVERSKALDTHLMEKQILILGKVWDHYTKMEQEKLEASGKIVFDEPGGNGYSVDQQGNWQLIVKGERETLDGEGEPVPKITVYPAKTNYRGLYSDPSGAGTSGVNAEVAPYYSSFK